MRGDAGFAVRLRFSKRGKVRFVGHRDLARAFERAFRVAELPLAFSHGFSPRPKVSLGLALGVGHESDAEYLDLELLEPVALGPLPNALAQALPDGVEVDGVVHLVPRAPALQESITSVEYRFSPAGLRGAQLAEAVERLLAAPEVTVETTRKGRTIVEDLRPGLQHLAALDDGSAHVEVATKPRGIRPTDLLGAMYDAVAADRGVGEDRVVRIRQWIERDGARQEPLAADRVPRASDDARELNKGLIDVRR
ncbi:MAG TPA: TIGR03936 family radical SAM-associated protein, partial [Acidimicrobiia bacterium]